VEDLKTSEAWRVFRIQAELIDGIETLNNLGPAVTIFGSARLPVDSPFYQDAITVAHDRQIFDELCCVPWWFWHLG